MGKTTRRQYLIKSSRLIAFLPFAGVIGCVSQTDSTLTPEESLKILIYILGPWNESEKQKAEDFAGRFLKAHHLSNSILTESSNLVQSLAGRFPSGSMAVKEIDLQAFPVEERDLLINLTKELYSLVEVRFDVAKEPEWGQCQGDSKWHTRTPA